MHAKFLFHCGAAQETLPGFQVSLIIQNFHVTGQRLDGVTQDEEKYLLSVYEKKTLENFLELAHSCQLAPLLQTSQWVEESQASPGFVLSCGTTAVSRDPRCSKHSAKYVFSISLLF